MDSLFETLSNARENGKPVFHFNVSTLEQFKAFRDISEDYPLILGESEGERKYFELDELANLVQFEKEKGKQLYLNADHSRSLESAKNAALLGCDAILLDVANLSYEENFRQTKELVEFRDKYCPKVLIESELGYIGGKSQVTSESIIIDPRNFTDPEQAKEFADKSKLDILAISVGNVHGISPAKKIIDFERIKKIRGQINQFLVLHGASGIDIPDLQKAVDAGITIIHINTELRTTWRNSLQKSLASKPGDVVPYEILEEVVNEVKEAALKLVKAFYK